MTFEEKLTSEAGNRGEIHLHLEGIFWKAYEKSAFLFVKYISDFKVTKKLVRAVKMDVVSVGFPSHSLERIAEGHAVAKTEDEKHVVITGFACSEEEFVEWKRSLPLFTADAVPHQGTVPQQQGGQNIVQQVPGVVAGGSATGTAVVAGEKSVLGVVPGQFPAQDLEVKVLERLLAFRVESSTPVECMLFITQLQKELSNKN